MRDKCIQGKLYHASVKTVKGGFMSKYFLIDLFNGKAFETNEKEFFRMVGNDRAVIPVHRVNGVYKFFLHGELIGYIEK